MALLALDETAFSLEAMAQRILDSLAQPVELGLQRVHLTASIGITVSPDDSVESKSLLTFADQALYEAKRDGRNTFHFFKPDMQATALRRAKLSNDLRAAWKTPSVYVVYQPIVSLSTGKVVKAEALVRWKHPELDAIEPTEFIPLAESSGMILELSDKIFKEAVTTLKAWRTQFEPAFQMSINKSPLQFKNTTGASIPWLDWLKEYDLPGDSLLIEITEGLLLDPKPEVKAVLERYHQAGVGVALDDFGTGYSSLAYLQKYEINILKIDRSFISSLKPSRKELVLSRAMIRMAHDLGLEVVAEGVETSEQAHLLSEIGCDYAQGYFWGRPVSAEEFQRRFLARSISG